MYRKTESKPNYSIIFPIAIFIILYTPWIYHEIGSNFSDIRHRIERTKDSEFTSDPKSIFLKNILHKELHIDPLTSDGRIYKNFIQCSIGTR